MITEVEKCEANERAPAEPTPTIPDYLTSPNAVFNDEGVQWRYGKAPDYSKTRKVWAEGKRMNHETRSLPEMVENLVKNWEVEASFKPRLSDWRTIDHEKYSFAMAGGPSQSAEDMIRVGTYNAIIAPNEYYSPENSDFASSHKTFKRMMPTFAWEVLEVYSGPPRVSFRWRHWGVMKNDYVGFNDKGEKVTAKAHGGLIDIEGVTVATVDDKVRLQDLQTWMDPLEMFRQIAPHGVVNRETMDRRVEKEAALDICVNADKATIAQEHNGPSGSHGHDGPLESVQFKHLLDSTGEAADAPIPHASTRAQDEKHTSLNPSHTSESSSNAASDDAQPGATEVWHDARDSVTEGPTMAETGAMYSVDAEIDRPASNYEAAKRHAAPGTTVASEALSDAVAKGKEHKSDAARSMYSSTVTGNVEKILEPAQRGEMVDESREAGARDAVDDFLERPADQVHPQSKQTEKHVAPSAGEAFASGADSDETQRTHEEMSRISASECPFLMNRE